MCAYHIGRVPAVQRKNRAVSIIMCPMSMSAFEQEVLTQPDAFRAMLAAYGGPDSPLHRLEKLGQAGKVGSVCFLGMGSSLFAAQPAVCYLEARGIKARAIDASEYLYYLWEPPKTGRLTVIISQSGESAETKRLVEKMAGQAYVAITNHEGSTLGRGAAVTLPMLGGVEKSTTNKTYTNSVAIALLLAQRLTPREPEPVADRLAAISPAMAAMLDGWRGRMAAFAEFLGPLPHLDIIGRGPSLATVGQGGLILRELAHVKTGAMNAGLFRHGLIPSMRDGGAMLAFAPAGRTDHLTLGMADEITAMGGRVVLVTDREVAPGPRKLVFRLPAVGELYAPMLEILPIELLGTLAAERKGMEPGEGIAKITEKE